MTRRLLRKKFNLPSKVLACNPCLKAPWENTFHYDQRTCRKKTKKKNHYSKRRTNHPLSFRGNNNKKAVKKKHHNADKETRGHFHLSPPRHHPINEVNSS
ncbi:hypothetical protein TNCV_635871 [Trichonephila clavipes]|nr:hypothetical protein TNCV_635871 [Trichonephila clavipes]